MLERPKVVLAPLRRYTSPMIKGDAIRARVLIAPSNPMTTESNNVVNLVDFVLLNVKMLSTYLDPVVVVERIAKA
jgi:hypothetical protein